MNYLVIIVGALIFTVITVLSDFYDVVTDPEKLEKIDWNKLIIMVAITFIFFVFAYGFIRKNGGM